MPPKRKRKTEEEEVPNKKQKIVIRTQQHLTVLEKCISDTIGGIIIPDLLNIIKSYCDAYICICGRMTDIPDSKVCVGCVAHRYDHCFECRHPIMASETNWMIHEIRWDLFQKHYDTSDNPQCASVRNDMNCHAAVIKTHLTPAEQKQWSLETIGKRMREFPLGQACYALYKYQKNPWDTATRQRKDKSLWNVHYNLMGGVECIRIVSMCHLCLFKPTMPYNGVWDGS